MLIDRIKAFLLFAATVNCNFLIDRFKVAYATVRLHYSPLTVIDKATIYLPISLHFFLLIVAVFIGYEFPMRCTHDRVTDLDNLSLYCSYSPDDVFPFKGPEPPTAIDDSMTPIGSYIGVSLYFGFTTFCLWFWFTFAGFSHDRTLRWILTKVKEGRPEAVSRSKNGLGHSIFLQYMFIKFGIIAVLFGVFGGLCSLLPRSDPFWGTNVLGEIVEMAFFGKKSKEIEALFGGRALCNYTVTEGPTVFYRVGTNYVPILNWVTTIVHCRIPANPYYKSGLLLSWFMLSGLIVANLYDLITTIVNFTFPGLRQSEMRRFCGVLDAELEEDFARWKPTIIELFLVQLVDNNISPAASETAGRYLFDDFLLKQLERGI